VELNSVWSRILRAEPNREEPYTLTDEPNRNNDLTDKEDPKFAKSSILTALPTFVMP
jgi:hypothetical protein